MTHSERIFSKPITELSFSDIETYFTEARSENDLIEFKSYDTGRNLDSNFALVHRAFCAFLNSQGGLIIWGAPVGTTTSGQTEKQFQGTLKPLQEVPGKDRIVNKLSDKIIPLPNNFNLEVIANSSNDKSIIVIEIQKSEYAPHQFDNTYYMRMDGQTRPAPHHYVEALFKQIKFPEIEGYIKFVRASVSGAVLVMSIEVYLFNFSPLQNEENVFYQVSISPGKFSTGHIQIGGNVGQVLSFGSPYMNPMSLTLQHQELHRTSGEITFILQFFGKSSPTKMSEYKLTINSIEELNTTQLAAKITHLSENKLVSDREETMSKNQKLQELLGRTYL